MQQGTVTFFRRYFVYFGSFAANMLSFSAGVTFNWASTIEPMLNSNDTSINPLPEPVTTLESTWIVSILNCGAIMGSLTGGVSVTKLGKKKTILLFGIPVLISHIIIAFATQWWMFLIGRFIMGLIMGGTYGVMTSFTGDISEDKNRGLLGSFTTLFMSLAGLFVYVIGPYTSIKTFSLLNIIPGILLFILFGLFVPETPYDLLQKISIEEARKSLALYRGKNITEVDAEFRKLQDSVISKGNTREKKPKTIEVLKTILKSKPLLRGLKIVMTIILFGSLTGMGAVAAYFQTIFEESSGSLKSTYSVMIIGVVTLFSTILNSQLVERLGRKLLLLVGFFFMSVALFSLGTYFYLKSEDYNTNPIAWLPLASLITYTIAFNIQGSIPWVLFTDIFSSYTLDLCGTIGSSAMLISAFIITLCFPYLQKGVGNYGTFYIFGCCTACAVVFIFIVLPETKGKSIEEVHEMLNNK